jgi:hypothetical protein
MVYCCTPVHCHLIYYIDAYIKGRDACNQEARGVLCVQINKVECTTLYIHTMVHLASCGALDRHVCLRQRIK